MKTVHDYTSYIIYLTLNCYKRKSPGRLVAVSHVDNNVSYLLKMSYNALQNLCLKLNFLLEKHK